MNEEKDKILSAVKEIYLKKGFYKTSMDEIAKELNISKKTIYKHFATKESLVEEVVNDNLLKIGNKLDEIFNSNSTAIEKIVEHINFVSNTIFKYSDDFAHDLRMHSPHLWNKIDEFRTQKIQNYLSKIIEQGKREGTFEDVPTELIIPILINSSRAIINPEFLSTIKFSFKDAIRATFRILFGGILTEAGKNNFKELLKETT
jgi:AcrR family transcriptional regulator